MKRIVKSSFIYKLLFVTIIMIAELSWWIIFTNRNTNEKIQELTEFFQTQKEVAEFMISKGIKSSEIHNRFKEYLLIAPNGAVYLNKKLLQERIEKEESKRTMFVSESSLFFVLILFSLLFVYKSYRNEIKLNRIQQNFMLSITHELKTPLASIKLYLQTLLNKRLDYKKKEEFVHTAVNEVDRLTSLIENILLSVKLDEQYEYTTDTGQSFAEIILRALEKFKISGDVNIISNLDETINTKIKSDVITVIINNLVSNAIKYGDENNEIEVQLSMDNEEIHLNVSDKGSGVTGDERKNIFERFYRIGSEDERSQSGTGLGLYIVSQIVKGLSGSIECLPNGEKGSIFKIKLPRE